MVRLLSFLLLYLFNVTLMISTLHSIKDTEVRIIFVIVDCWFKTLTRCQNSKICRLMRQHKQTAQTAQTATMVSETVVSQSIDQIRNSQSPLYDTTKANKVNTFVFVVDCCFAFSHCLIANQHNTTPQNTNNNKTKVRNQLFLLFLPWNDVTNLHLCSFSEFTLSIQLLSFFKWFCHCFFVFRHLFLWFFGVLFDAPFDSAQRAFWRAFSFHLFLFHVCSSARLFPKF